MNPADVAVENTLLVTSSEALKLTGVLHGVLGGHDASRNDDTQNKDVHKNNFLILNNIFMISILFLCDVEK
jgi:hypothetical protein